MGDSSGKLFFLWGLCLQGHSSHSNKNSWNICSEQDGPELKYPSLIVLFFTSRLPSKIWIRLPTFEACSEFKNVLNFFVLTKSNFETRWMGEKRLLSIENFLIELNYFLLSGKASH